MVLVLADAVGFYHALQRFALGLPASFKANLFAAKWQPPGGVVVPLLLMAGFVIVAFVLIVRADTRPAARSTVHDDARRDRTAP